MVLLAKQDWCEQGSNYGPDRRYSAPGGRHGENWRVRCGLRLGLHKAQTHRTIRYERRPATLSCFVLVFLNSVVIDNINPYNCVTSVIATRFLDGVVLSQIIASGRIPKPEITGPGDVVGDCVGVAQRPVRMSTYAPGTIWTLGGPSLTLTDQAGGGIMFWWPRPGPRKHRSWGRTTASTVTGFRFHPLR